MELPVPKYNMFLKKKRLGRLTKQPKKVKVPVPVKKFVHRALDKSKEDHEVELNLNGIYSSIANAWIETDLTDIAEGDDAVANRTGREIKIKYAFLDANLVGGQVNGVTDDAYDNIRMVLALWDSTSATPLASNGAVLDSLIQKNRAWGRGLSRKLYDRFVLLQTPGKDSSGYIPAVRHIRFFIPINKIIKYNSTAGTTANQKLIFSCRSDSIAVPNPGFVFGKLVVHFEDQ